MANDAWVYDGFESVIDGMNSSIEGEHLGVTQYARGINVMCRKGVLTTRYGLPEYPISIEAAKTGTIQGAFRYQLNSAEYIAWVISGRIYLLNLTSGTLTDISATFFVSLDVSARVYFCKAEKFLVIQDGINPAIICNGVASARQAAANEVPIGTIMAYGHGRLFVVPKTEPVSGEDGRRFILAGDIFKPNDPESVLRFIETQYLSGGGAFALPAEMGFIGGMFFTRNQATGNGYGPLIVFARRGACAFSVDQPRETLYDLNAGIPVMVRAGWQDVDISQVLFLDVGSASPFSLLPVNADLLFRGTKDGMRSLSITVTEATTTLRNASMSGEMADVFSEGGDSMLSLVSAALSDNRVMFTAVPAEDETYFRGVASLDMNTINNVKMQMPPSFDGTFTGPRWYQILNAEYNGRDRMFAFVKTNGGMKLVYEDEDAIADLTETPIHCRVYTRKFNCGRSDVLKTLDHIRLWLSDVKGDVEMSVYVRTDDYPFWTQMDETQTFSAPTTGREQQRRDIVFAANKELTDPVEGGNGIQGYVFQFALVWTGHCKIKRAKIRAMMAAEPNTPAEMSAEEGVELSDAGNLDLEATDYETVW